MTTCAESFDANIARWKENQHTPWQRLLYSVTCANLSRHLPRRSLHVLDAGGGSGTDAIDYATRGHTVALLDFSAEMLADARRQAKAHGVAQRVTFYHADVADVPALFPAPTFEVVLCHNVLPYVDDLAALLPVPLLPVGALFPACRPQNKQEELIHTLAPSIHAWVADDFDAPFVDLDESTSSYGALHLRDVYAIVN